MPDDLPYRLLTSGPELEAHLRNPSDTDAQFNDTAPFASHLSQDGCLIFPDRAAVDAALAYFRRAWPNSGPTLIRPAYRPPSKLWMVPGLLIWLPTELALMLAVLVVGPPMARIAALLRRTDWCRHRDDQCRVRRAEGRYLARVTLESIPMVVWRHLDTWRAIRGVLDDAGFQRQVRWLVKGRVSLCEVEVLTRGALVAWVVNDPRRTVFCELTVAFADGTSESFRGAQGLGPCEAPRHPLRSLEAAPVVELLLLASEAERLRPTREADPAVLFGEIWAGRRAWRVGRGLTPDEVDHLAGVDMTEGWQARAARVRRVPSVL